MEKTSRVGYTVCNHLGNGSYITIYLVVSYALIALIDAYTFYNNLNGKAINLDA